jgi:predicted phosphodiesterase
MTSAQFAEGIRDQMEAAPEILLGDDARVVVMGDFHAGDGSPRDDLARNGPLLLALLEGHYLARGYSLVLNGDIEDRQRFPLAAIRAAWGGLFALLDRFAAEGRLYKIYGNHDLDLIAAEGYPYALHPGVKLLRGGRTLYAFHGHQASGFLVKHNRVSGALIKYFISAFGIKSLNVSKDSRRKYRIERRIYRFSRDEGLISIIGHTHRPLFESLSKFDRLRFAIERLCREYPTAAGERQGEIAAAVEAYKIEFRRLRRRDKRRGGSLGLYGREILLPCLFNSGCAVGKKGITAIELEGGRIDLVYWFKQGSTRRYLGRELARAELLQGTPYRRVSLESDRLDFLFARLDLLGQGLRP